MKSASRNIGSMVSKAACCSTVSIPLPYHVFRFKVSLMLVLALSFFAPKAWSSVEPPYRTDPPSGLKHDSHELPLAVKVELFELFTGCESVHVVIEELGPEARVLALHEADIQNLAESRLRAAQIYAEQPSLPFLRVWVNIASDAFWVQVEFNKAVYDKLARDMGTAFPGVARTWARQIVGTYGTDGPRGGSFISSTLSRLLDEFLAEYLRINGLACELKTLFSHEP